MSTFALSLSSMRSPEALLPMRNRFETFQCQEFNRNNIWNDIEKWKLLSQNMLRNIAPNMRKTLWMKPLAQWTCAPKTPKTHPGSKNPASLRFETTYLDVLDALNHEKAMIHNTLFSKHSCNNENLNRKMFLFLGDVSYKSIWNVLQKIIFFVFSVITSSS